MRTCCLGGRTSGGFNFLLNVSYEIRSFLMNTFFLKKKKKGRVGSEAKEHKAHSASTGDPVSNSAVPEPKGKTSI